MPLERGVVMFLYIFLHHCSIIGTKTYIQLAIGYGEGCTHSFDI